MEVGKASFTVVQDVILQHLVLQDATELRQRLQMDHMDDQRPQEVIQGQAEFLQKLTVTNTSDYTTCCVSRSKDDNSESEQ